jgi:hypothetical protein
MFKRTARVPIIGSAVVDPTSSTLVFQKTASKNASYYQANQGRINVREMLAMVAEDYDISTNPHDYIFEAVRAVTAEVPNENGDAFPKKELLRFDHRLGKAVYQTFIGKPHHINHRADNPKASRGVVLDASYNDIAPPLESCPSCGHRTAELEGRDESGINCVKCGTAVKDEFVELLLAIDTKKDPIFAEGVRTGSLDSLSMGCEAGYTDCSICGNRARTVAQFCQHIKSGNKKKVFKTASGERMSFEKCGEVVFTEISRVDQPADPTAKQREVFQINSMPIQLESEMLVMSSRLAKLEEAVKKAAQLNATQAMDGQKSADGVSPQVPFKNVAESIKWAESSIDKLNTEINRLMAEKAGKHKEASDAGDSSNTYESGAYDAQIEANRQYIARLEDYIAKASKMEASGQSFDDGLAKQVSQFLTSKEGQSLDNKDKVERLKTLHPEMAPILDKLQPGDDYIPNPMSIGDYAKKRKELVDKDITPAEMGMELTEGGSGLPATTASKVIEQRIASDLDALLDSVKESNVNAEVRAFKFADSYKNLEATVTKSGNVKVHTADGTLFVVRPNPKPANKKEAKKVATEILTHIANNGIVETVLKYETVLSPKMAQVLEYYIVDFDGGRVEGDAKSMLEGGDDDLGDKRGKPGKSLVEEETTDHKKKHEKRDLSNADVLEEHQPDHVEVLSKDVESVVSEENSDMADGHGKPADDTQKDLVVDFADKKPKSAGKTAQMDMEAPVSEGPVSDGSLGGDMSMEAAGDVCANEMCASSAGKGGADDCMCPPDCDCKCACKCADGKVAKDASAAVPTTASLMIKEATKKYVSRLERLYKSRLSKVNSDAAQKVAEAEKAAMEKVANKFLRALKLAAKRQALNLEFSPLKAAFCDVLTSELDIDAESYYPGMDVATATHIIEAATENGFDHFVDTLTSRAAEFVNMSDEVLTTLENDIKNIRPAPVVATTMRAKKAARDEVRRAAVDGNFTVAPSPTSETISNVGNRDNIRSALGSTKVRRASQVLLKR